MTRVRHVSFLAILFLVNLGFPGRSTDKSVPTTFLTMEITGAVDPVIKDYVLEGLQRARDTQASAVLIRMDTPGGLLDATRDIVSGILNSPVPVIVFVGPQGARAASAGVFITLAADVAAMAPQTHLGAAHPVSVGGGIPFMPSGKNGKEESAGDAKNNSVMEEKAVSDTSAYARTLATTKGRNAEWAEKAVRESVSLTADEALTSNVIDLMANDEKDLLQKLSGRQIGKGGITHTLQLENSTRIDFSMSMLRQWLHAIANPNVAYLLLVLGFYALVYEFSSPGIGLGAITGIICLVLAFFSLQVLPLNFAGLALLGAGLIMMGLDILVGSHGLLIFGGLVSFALGSFFLFDTHQSVFRVSMVLILALLATSGGFFGLVVQKIWIARRKAPVTGAIALVGQTAELREGGMVFVEGALWTVESGAEGLPPGARVRVEKVLGNRLIVRKEA
jgi:membrane-bound serine protease (ClpP class)